MCLYFVTVCLFSCTALFVSIGQVIGCEDRLRNDLYCAGWGVKLCSTSTLHVSSEIALWVSERARKKWVAEALFFVTISATFLGSISAKLSKNTCPGGGSRHMVSYSRKVSIKGSNLPKNLLFRVPYCDQPTVHGKRCATPTLFPSPSGHPTDAPFI